MIEILLLWLPLCFVAAWVASQKGRSGVGIFFLSLFLSPVIGLLVVIALPRLELTMPARRGSDYILCHGCNRPRRADAFTCPRCGAGATPEPQRLASAMGTCPGCRRRRGTNQIKCIYCGNSAPPL